MNRTCILAALLLTCVTAAAQQTDTLSKLTAAQASRLAQLPLKCVYKEFPYKTGVVFSDTGLITAPKNYHPAFYGCFDWHSAVHGHWMLVRLLKQFPGLPEKAAIEQALNTHLTEANIQQELALFSNKDNKSFERTYGWAWLLQLQNDLITWNHPRAKTWSAALQPLTNKLSANTVDFLNRLVYPIRVGEHTNLAFGLSLMYDYAVTAGDTALKNSITRAANRFYYSDRNCPLQWEPSGYDFLSPCLEEAALMSKILPAGEYRNWLAQFLPQLTNPQFQLLPGRVLDRTDGKLVHLDGLNLSRVWCLKNIRSALLKAPVPHKKPNRGDVANIERLIQLHLAAALPKITSGDYAGEHWLASFAVYALTVGGE